MKYSYTKNVGICGFPGGGKTWCMIYCILYDLSKGLKVTSKAVMCKRALQLGVIHINKLFNIPTKEKLTPHRWADLENLNLTNKPQNVYFLLYVDMLAFDEMDQSSAEILATFDITFRKIRNSNIYMGGVLIIFSINNTQIQPIWGHPFLISCHIISCFKMVTLENSVQASNAGLLKCIQKIAWFN